MGKLRSILQYSPLLMISYIVVLGLVYLYIPDIVFKVPLMPVFGNALVMLNLPTYEINYIPLLVFVPYIFVSICSLWLRGKYRTVFLNLFSFFTFADTIAMLCFLIINSGIGQLAEVGAQYSIWLLLILCLIELFLSLATNTLIWKGCGKALEKKTISGRSCD